MEKFSKLSQMIAAVPEVVKQDIEKMPRSPRTSYQYNEETKSFEQVTLGEYINTVFGPVSDEAHSVALLTQAMEKVAIKAIHVRYGRSKYMPHQSTRETNRRKAQYA